jgi:hypothetical protein
MRTILSLFILTLATVAWGQRIKTTEGSIAVLNGQTEVNVEFTYDNMSVGKFPNEADYVADRKKTMNEKEAGTGDKWAVNWVDDRANRYEPKFFELFNKESVIQGGAKPNAKYTMIVHTSFTEPGFNVGVMRKNAALNAEVTVVETANRGKVLCKITIEGAQGGTAFGYDFDTGLRISECYAVVGKRLGAIVKKGK